MCVQVVVCPLMVVRSAAGLNIHQTTIFVLFGFTLLELILSL
jgi:hypothetical protein